MSTTIRVSLPGYDAKTDTNPDHYALYSDQDWVLIKEYTRGSIQATSAGNSISYPLNYIPTVFCYYKIGNVWREATGQLFDPIEAFPAITEYPVVFMIPGFLSFHGNDPVTPTDFKYFVCYDRQL